MDPMQVIDELGVPGELPVEEEVRGMRGRVRRLTHGLPAFESVWVDALAQARLLTAFQAVEFNEVVNLADHALLEAKAGGRDRIVVAGDSETDATIAHANGEANPLPIESPTNGTLEAVDATEMAHGGVYERSTSMTR